MVTWAKEKLSLLKTPFSLDPKYLRVWPWLAEIGGVAPYAAESLGSLGDKRAVKPLLAVLGRRNFMLQYAIKALGKLGDKRAVGPLTEMLEDQNPHVRKLAAEALSKLKGQAE